MERGDKFRYSCKCGWLDAAHIDFGVPAGIEGLVFGFSIDWELTKRINPAIAQHRLRAFTPSIISAFGVNVGSSYAVIDEKHPTYLSNPEGIALGVWMDTQWRLEGSQNLIPFTPTSFSIEDLVSNLTGYAAFRAGQSWDKPQVDETAFSLGLQDADYSATWENQWLKDECGILSKEESLDMLDRFENAGGFPKNYAWTPLPLPTGVTNPYCNVDVTVAYRNTSMARLLPTAVLPGVAGEGAVWWWESGHAYRWRVSDFDHRAQEWNVIRDNLYVTLPMHTRFGGGC